MTDINWELKPQDIEWEMDWSGTREDGTRLHPDKPEKEMIFEETGALAHLLMNEVIFLNSHWWKEREGWPKDACEITSLNVNCNDVFAWGCADAEELPHGEIENLYRMWRKDPSWGPAAWCIMKRKELPQGPVAKRMVANGWDMDELVKDGARPNIYDSLSTLYAKRKYNLYCEWERSRGQEPRPWDAGWWAGWKEYKEAHPDFKEYGEDSEWHKENMRLRAEWLKENGYGQD